MTTHSPKPQAIKAWAIYFKNKNGVREILLDSIRGKPSVTKSDYEQSMRNDWFSLSQDGDRCLPILITPL
jgi:hypothetical protein